MVAEIGKDRLSGLPAAIESPLRFAGGGRLMTKAADKINERSDGEYTSERRSYLEGVQLGIEAVLKALPSSVSAIYEPETADDRRPDASAPGSTHAVGRQDRRRDLDVAAHLQGRK